MFTAKTWLGQVTTGAGAMLLAPTLLALLAHQMTLAQAIPPLAAGVIGLIWPENKKLGAEVQSVTAQAVQLAPAVAVDGRALLDAYRDGLTHGVTLAHGSPLPIAAPAVPAPTPQG